MSLVTTQKRATKESVWSVWLPIGLGAVVFLSITFIGNILIIDSELRAFSPALEWAFNGGIVLVLLWFIVIPGVRVLNAPVVALDDVTSSPPTADLKTLKKIAHQLVNSGSLPPEQQDKLTVAVCRGEELHGLLAEAIQAQKLSATKIIREHAVLVFVSTAISQNGRLDAVSVAVTNFRLVHRLVKHFGYRPPLPELIRIYSHVFMAAVVADGISDLDVEGVLSHLGLSFLDAIPGSRLIIDSAFDGAVNALFTLRVGFVTQKCLLSVGKEFIRSEVRKAANREARLELITVLREAAPAVPVTIKGIIEKWL